MKKASNIFLIILTVLLIAVSFAGYFLNKLYSEAMDKISDVEFIRTADKSLLKAYSLMEDVVEIEFYYHFAIKIGIILLSIILLIVVLKIIFKKLHAKKIKRNIEEEVNTKDNG